MDDHLVKYIFRGDSHRYCTRQTKVHQRFYRMRIQSNAIALSNQHHWQSIYLSTHSSPHSHHRQYGYTADHTDSPRPYCAPSHPEANPPSGYLQSLQSATTDHLVAWASHYSKGSGGWALGFLECPRLASHSPFRRLTCLIPGRSSAEQLAWQ